jgi:hypothetical protein
MSAWDYRKARSRPESSSPEGCSSPFFASSGHLSMPVGEYERKPRERHLRHLPAARINSATRRCLGRCLNPCLLRTPVANQVSQQWAVR